jgi:hypothetical protein
MRTRREWQRDLWIPSGGVARGASHPFYSRLNRLLPDRAFDRFV